MSERTHYLTIYNDQICHIFKADYYKNMIHTIRNCSETFKSTWHDDVHSMKATMPYIDFIQLTWHLNTKYIYIYIYMAQTMSSRQYVNLGANRDQQ